MGHLSHCGWFSVVVTALVTSTTLSYVQATQAHSAWPSLREQVQMMMMMMFSTTIGQKTASYAYISAPCIQN